MSEKFWYPKCIVIYGCEVPDDKVYNLINKFYGNYKYIVNNELIDKFYDDVSVGAFTKDNLYELRRYKTSEYPFEETFYFILSKIIIDISTTGNIKLNLKDPNIDDIKIFTDLIDKLGLTYSRYLIIN
jgi:hypothetical protein